MPNTPQVNFKFTNNNVQNSVPLLGVTHVLARTTRGQFEDPSELIRSYAQFQRLFGEEIVPDGSISNIKKALEMGSILRISRVKGSGAISYGTAKVYTYSSGEVGEQETPIKIVLTDPANSANKVTLELNIKTKEQGSAIVDPNNATNSNFFLVLSNGGGPANKVYLTQVTKVAADGTYNQNNVLSSNLLFSYSKAANNPAFIEPSVYQTFLDNVPNLQLDLKSCTGEGAVVGYSESVKTINNVYGVLRDCAAWKAVITVGETNLESATAYLAINEGENGGAPNADSWKSAYEATKAYEDGYQLICSHLCQYTETDHISVLQYIAKDVEAKFETVLYVEVPKYTDGNPKTPEEIVTWLKTNQPKIGNSKSVAYFAGGIKYYDENGVLQDCDVLGSVIGLGDVSASNFGPWYSFSGMNRGVITSALGPVTENLGGPGKVEVLQSLAEWYCNLFVIKDTRAMGKQTMLWHGFTSNPRNDSEKFLSIVRLNLYIKKNLRPILESYLEEPNIWDTWRSIYFEGKEIMDDLVNRRAMSEYQWLGDQDAGSYEDLQINNEADVRQGKYHLVIKYKDIVPLQEVTVDVIIDAASKSVDVTSSSES